MLCRGKPDNRTHVLFRNEKKAPRLSFRLQLSCVVERTMGLSVPRPGLGTIDRFQIRKSTYPNVFGNSEFAVAVAPRVCATTNHLQYLLWSPTLWALDEGGPLLETWKPKISKRSCFCPMTPSDYHHLNADEKPINDRRLTMKLNSAKVQRSHRGTRDHTFQFFSLLLFKSRRAGRRSLLKRKKSPHGR